MLGGKSQPRIRQRDLGSKRANHQKTCPEKKATTKMIVSAMAMPSAVTGTNGMIATGGMIIVTRSFSLTSDNIFWREAIGTRPMAKIIRRDITISMSWY